MTFPTLECARFLRDGGIDAMAALDAVIFDAIAGLSPQEQQRIKRAFGDAMGGIIEHLIGPAVRAYPELETDQETWSAIAGARAAARAGRSNQALHRTPSAPEA
jgi:hypothetical protein